MNDANCFTLSEAIDGAGKDYKSVFGVIIGTGTGGGLVFDKVEINNLAVPDTLPGPWTEDGLMEINSKFFS